ncbi:MAG: MFS transporter [Dehalococcoidia bacterium]|nr:MFS transporter [Dehalococcoidia bacterium]
MTGPVAGMERRVIVSASLAHAMTHTLELTFAALLIRIGFEFGVREAALGAVATAGTLTFGVFALPSGWLVDRWGPRAVMVTAMWSAAVFALFVAVSPNLLLLSVALALLGCGIGLYHPAGTAMVATVAERRGVALAAHGIAGNAGVSIAPAAATVIAFAFDWRIAYVVFAIAAAATGVLIMRIAPSRSEAAEAVAARARAFKATTRKAPRTAPPAERRWMMWPLVLIFVAAIGQGFIYRGSLTFLTLHLEEHLGLSLFGWDAEAVAGGAAAVVLLAAVFGQSAGGTLSDRIPVEWAPLPFLVVAAPFLVLMGATTGVLLLLASAVFVMSNWAQQPIFNGLITDYSPANAVGRAFGINFFLTFGLGSFAAGFAGAIAEAWGTPAVFYALAGVALAELVAMSIVARGANRRRRAMSAAVEASMVAGGG